MSNVFISMMMAAGVTAWTYNKFQKRTGGYTQRAISGALVAGALSFLIMLTVLWATV